MYTCKHFGYDFCFFQADSGFFCEGYSSDEDVLLKEEFRGNIVKQGCLLKQVKKKIIIKKACLHVSRSVMFSP